MTHLTFEQWWKSYPLRTSDSLGPTWETAPRAAFEAGMAAALEAGEPWVAMAYARLGVVRDRMTPLQVETVQAFLGPLG